MDKNLPTIVIFGRTNTGKSTLFNKLTEKKDALVSDVEGTTRDSNFGICEWNRYQFNVIDTGGIIELEHLKKVGKKRIIKDVKTEEEIDIKVQQQAREFLINADIVLFLVSVRDGLLPQDKAMALELKKNHPDLKKIMLIANKADSPGLRLDSSAFNKLSMGEPIPVSATTGSGVGDMLDLLIKKIKKKKPAKKKKPEEQIEKINVSIIGKPNVGKSSLINKLIGEEKIIVSPIAHTTREPNDAEIIYNDKIINFIDTAGISKKGQKLKKKKKFVNDLQKKSIEKSLATLHRADIVLLMLEINKKITHQDAKLIEEILENRCSLIIIANKWDLVEEKDTKEYTELIRDTLPFVRWAPIHFVSAKTGSKVDKIMDLILEVAEARKTEVSDNALSKLLNKVIKIHRPAKAKGTKRPFIHELKQLYSNPPKFLVRIGSKDTLHFSYVRFIENRIREKFGFKGTPVSIIVEKNKKVHGKADS